jgi:hypothetical protein
VGSSPIASTKVPDESVRFRTEIPHGVTAGRRWGHAGQYENLSLRRRHHATRLFRTNDRVALVMAVFLAGYESSWAWVNPMPSGEKE